MGFYLSKMIGYMLVALVLYSILRGIVLYRKRKKTYLKKEIVRGMMVAYFVGLFSQTLIPYYFHLATEIHPEHMIRTITIQMPYQRETFNFVPFRQILFFLKLGANYTSLTLVNLLGNIALFVPFGFLLPVYNHERFSTVRKVTFYGILLSICIESLQFFIGRTVDVDDVMLNALGAAIGAGIYQVLPNAIVERISVRHLGQGP